MVPEHAHYTAILRQMSALLLLVPWLCLIIALRERMPNWRDTFLAASIWWGVGVVIITETLSLFHEISFGPVVAAWILFSCAAVFASFIVRSRPPSSSVGRRPDLRDYTHCGHPLPAEYR